MVHQCLKRLFSIHNYQINLTMLLLESNSDWHVEAEDHTCMQLCLRIRININDLACCKAIRSLWAYAHWWISMNCNSECGPSHLQILNRTSESSGKSLLLHTMVQSMAFMQCNYLPKHICRKFSMMMLLTNNWRTECLVIMRLVRNVKCFIIPSPGLEELVCLLFSTNICYYFFLLAFLSISL